MDTSLNRIGRNVRYRTAEILVWISGGCEEPSENVVSTEAKPFRRGRGRPRKTS